MGPMLGEVLLRQGKLFEMVPCGASVQGTIQIYGGIAGFLD